MKFTIYLSTALKSEECLLTHLFQHVKFFLKNRTQRVVLNGQASSSANVLAGLPQESIPGAIFSWFTSKIYQMSYPQTLNYLLTTHLFLSVTHDNSFTVKILNGYLKKYLSGLINGKWASIVILLNKHKQYFSRENTIKLITQWCFLTTIYSKRVHHKNNLE